MATQEHAPTFSRLVPQETPTGESVLSRALREMIAAEEKLADKLSELGPVAYPCARDSRNLAAAAKKGVPQRGTAGAIRP